MTTGSEYGPSPEAHVATHVADYEKSGDVYSGPFEGQPTVILTTVGRKTGRVRKTPLVRVEHNGRWAVVASHGGAPQHPAWFLNLLADANVQLQDGPTAYQLKARVIEGSERDLWWKRATEIWPAYDEYTTRTDRVIPVVLLEE